MCAANVVVEEVVISSKRNNSFQGEQRFLAVLTVLASVLQYFQYFDLNRNDNNYIGSSRSCSTFHLPLSVSHVIKYLVWIKKSTKKHTQHRNLTIELTN